MSRLALEWQQAYGVAEVVARHPNCDDRYLASQSLFSLAHVYERLTDFRKRIWFRELPGSLRYASLLSDLPSHGEFLFSERVGPSQELKLLPMPDILEHCDKDKGQYEKLKTSTYVFLAGGVYMWASASMFLLCSVVTWELAGRLN